MRKIVVQEFVSLDGVMQAPGDKEDTDGGFTQGGWAWPYWEDEIDAYMGESMSEVDTCLLGRKTWQNHGAAFEPMPEGDSLGDRMKATPKYVVSTTLTDTSLWRNSTVIRDNVIERVRALKAQPGKNIGIDGSSVLVHALAQHDLVDEYILLVFPLVLGGGKRMFPEGQRINLRLVESRPFSSGVVLMRYVPDRAEGAE
jgi:dihydrofolate reductase